MSWSAGERRRYVTEKRYLRADGRLVWVSLSLSPVRDEDGDTLYLISQMQDITERKRSEEGWPPGQPRPADRLHQPHLFTDRIGSRRRACGAPARSRCCH